MELVIFNQLPQELIKFNHEELIQELNDKLSHYNSLTYTDAEIKLAKADRATLNKFKTAIDTRRKEIKSQCMRPYEDFEEKVKQIIKMIDQPILAIDTQVKTYEQRVRAEKKAEIITFFNETIGELIDLVPIEKIWVEKWLNAAESMKNIKDDIKLSLDKVRSDLSVIDSLHSEFELPIRETYLKSLSLSVALQEKARLEEQKAKQEAYNKAQEEKRERERLEAEEQARLRAERIEAAKLAKEEAEKKLVSEEIAEELIPEPEQITLEQIAEEVVEVEEVKEDVQPQELMQVNLEVLVTPDLLEALEGFLVAYEIEYRMVK